jgi:penicillin-binding protein 1A
MLSSMSTNRKILLSSFTIIGFLVAAFALLYISFDPQPVNVDNIINHWKLQDRVDHEFVSLSEIPLFCQQAFIAIEDKNYYSHIGIDAAGMWRGVRGALTGEDLGGSTIPQQLIKNYTAQIYNRSLSQKITESIFAVRLDFYYSKEYILETYLNVIYLGDFNYGISAAAQDYFSKQVSELSVEECAYLAAITQRPEVYKPSTNLEAGQARQQLVLKLMKEQGYIN